MPKVTKFRCALVALILTTTVPASFLIQSASASTAACGDECSSPSNESLGSGEVLTVSGSNVEMAAASTTSSAQDWIPENEGSVSDAVNYQLISSKYAWQYSGDSVYEYQYAPDGVSSGQCLAANDTTYSTDAGLGDDTQDISVMLYPCGTSTETLWILDATGVSNGYEDLINADQEGTCTASGDCSLNTPFSNPAVLTVSGKQLVVAPITSTSGVVSATQSWANYTTAAAQVARAKASARKS
jgi:hypothetical protein